jgi:hypothetical protein
VSEAEGGSDGLDLELGGVAGEIPLARLLLLVRS